MKRDLRDMTRDALDEILDRADQICTDLQPLAGIRAGASSTIDDARRLYDEAAAELTRRLLTDLTKDPSK